MIRVETKILHKIFSLSNHYIMIMLHVYWSRSSLYL